MIAEDPDADRSPLAALGCLAICIAVAVLGVLGALALAAWVVATHLLRR